MNLLFVFADELRTQSVGCYPNDDVQTPALDRLAREGMVFTNACSNTPVCTPARGSLLTGCWPVTHKAVGNDLPVEPGMPSIARSLADAGYACGYVGKWHLGGTPRDRFVPPGPERLGFDDFWASWNCHTGHFRPRWYRDSAEVHTADGRYEPEVNTDLALEGLDAFTTLDPDRPFCFFVSYKPPHSPYRPVPASTQDRYDPSALSLRPNCADDPKERQDLADYYAHVTAVDEQLGRLVGWLEETGRLDDTLVVFSSDHGSMLGSHGRHYKQVPFAESIRVPLVMRGGPCLEMAGRRDDLLIGLVDLAPTLLGLLGAPVPPRMQGLDLSGFVRDPIRLGRPESLYLQNALVFDQAVREGVAPWWGVWTGQHTYARTLDGPWLLFDNEADPYQLTNLVAEQPSELQASLAELLGGWIAVTGDSVSTGEEYAEHCGVGDTWRTRQDWFEGVRRAAGEALARGEDMNEVLERVGM